MPLAVTPLPGPHGFGATVTGLQGASLAALDDATRDALLAGAGGSVDFAGTTADARNQGGGGSACHAPGCPTVRTLGNASGAKGAEALLCRMGYEWHADGVKLGVYSVLHCVATPSVGGETLFADAAAIYSRLSPAQRAFAHTATVVQSNRFTAGGPAAVDCEAGVRMDRTGTRRTASAATTRPGWSLNETRFPLVGHHPARGSVLHGGGKNLDHLVVSKVAEGAGAAAAAAAAGEEEALSPEASSDALSSLLIAGLRPLPPGGDGGAAAAVDGDGLLTEATAFDPASVLALRWEAGDTVVWDNYGMLHSTTPVGLYGPGRRAFYHVIAQDVRRGAGDCTGVAARASWFMGSGAGAPATPPPAGAA